ncbi:T9SS C-terminal target domain-containing protein [Marinilabiliaceae bacterium JC017]|nr:T9SS C-terminal target domain-containing protein [Marinilabiliaceae bacterium JC017]
MKKFYLIITLVWLLGSVAMAQFIQKLPDNSPQNVERINTYQLRTVTTKVDLEERWKEQTKKNKERASLLKSSSDCSSIILRGKYGWDLVKVLKETPVSCLDKFMLKTYDYDIRQAYEYNNFENLRIVLDEIKGLVQRGEYDGTNSCGIAGLVYFVRGYVYWSWTQDNLDIEKIPYLYDRIVSTFTVLGNQPQLYTSKDPSNAAILEQFLLVADFQNAGNTVTWRGEFLNAVVKTMKEISSEKIFAIEDQQTRKAFLSAYSRLNFYFFRGSFVPGQSDEGMETAINNNPEFYTELERILKDTELMENAESSFFIRDLAGELGRLASMYSQRDKVKSLAEKIIQVLPEGSEAWLALLDKYTYSAEVDDLGEYNMETVKEDIYNKLFPYTYEFDGGALLMKTGLPIETAIHQYHAAKMVQAQFFRMSQTTEPVPGDEHETLIMQVYSTLSDYKNYQPFLTGISADNGGMYIENICTFYTYERRVPQDSYLSLEELFRHEYTHYLQGRFLIHGDWLTTEILQNHQGIWFEEGQAECCAWSTRDEGMKKRNNIISQLVPDKGNYMTLNKVVHSSYDNGTQFYNYACALMYYFMEKDPNYLNQFIDAAKANDVEKWKKLREDLGNDADLQKVFNAYLDELIARYQAGEYSDPSTQWVPETRLTCNNKDQFINEFETATGLDVVSSETIETGGYPRIKLTVNLTSQDNVNRIAAAKAFNEQLDAALKRLNSVEAINNYLYTNAYFGKLVHDGTRYTTTAIFDGPFRGVDTDYDTDGDGVVDGDDDFPNDFLGYDDANGNGVLDPEEMPDTDGDGMPDGWEKLYNLDMNDASDADKDGDGDFNSNLFEWQNNTDPTDYNSCIPVGDMVNRFTIEEDRRNKGDEMKSQDGSWVGIGWETSDDNLPLKKYTDIKLYWESSMPIEILKADNTKEEYFEDKDIDLGTTGIKDAPAMSGVISFPDFDINDFPDFYSHWIYFQVRCMEDGYLNLKFRWESSAFEANLENNIVEDYFILGNVQGMLNSPSNVIASIDEYTNKVEVKWDIVEGATSYKVFRSAQSDFSNAVEKKEITDLAGIVEENVITYEDVDVVRNVDYFYKVQAVNGSVASDLSLQTAGRALLPLPKTPSNFAFDLTNNGEKLVILSWDAVDFAANYIVYRSVNADMSDKQVAGESDDTELIDNVDDISGDFIYYQVVAKNAKGESDASGIAKVSLIANSTIDKEVNEGLTVVYQRSAKILTGLLTCNETGEFTVELFNIGGVCVMQKQQDKATNDITFDCPTTGLSNGIYILSVRINGKVFVKKINI